MRPTAVPSFSLGSDRSRSLVVHALCDYYRIHDPFSLSFFSSFSSFVRAARRPCQQNQAVYNYPVLREALNVMSQVPAADQQGVGNKQVPLLLMRTVLESVQRFPELKNFVATVVLVRLVQQKVRAKRGVGSHCSTRAAGRSCRWSPGVDC